MHTFAQKPKTTQTTTLPSWACFGQNREAKPNLSLQPRIGNQAKHWIPSVNQKPARRDSTTTGSPQFGYNFVRIPVNHYTSTTNESKQQMPNAMDARGGRGEGELEDQRPKHTPSATGGPPAPLPTPINVRNGPNHSAINSGDRVGMSIAIAISSSSGRDADMAVIQDSEQVGLSYNHTGSISGVPPLPSSQSGFMAGYPIPDDQHAWSKRVIINLADNHGGNGSFEKKQLDIFKYSTSGATTPAVIPASGYIIKRIITKTGTSISFRTEKRPSTVTVNGYTTTAGPSPLQGETVVVRSATAAPTLSRGAKTAIGIGGGAIIGAGIGALAGPVGAGVGAVIGGIAGGIGSLAF